MHTNRRLLSEERLFSPAYYYAVGTSGYAVKSHKTSVVLWLDYLHTSLQYLFLLRIIHKSLRDVRPLRYSSRDGHAEGEHLNRGRDTASICPTLQVLDMSICCVCLGCCASEFGSSRGTYELPCISVFAFITRVEFVYEAFRLHYKLREKRGITGQRVVIYIYVCGRSWEHPAYYFF
jgi:hypothetical protein